MAVTIEHVDQLLAEWQQKLNWVSQNLIDLQSTLTYQRLAGTGGFLPLPLTGITAQRVLPALSALDELFQHFDRLRGTIDHARELRKQVPRFLGVEQKLEEIERLLTGDSIQLAIVQIPLAQRGLLSAAETATAIAPSDLLRVMTDAFEVARDAVFAVDAAWTRLEPQLIEAEAEIQSLTQQAAELGIEVSQELTIARQTTAELRDSIDLDPLGVTEEMARSIQPLLTQIRTRLDQQVQQQRQLHQGLTIARQQLQDLTELNQQAIVGHAEVQEKVSDVVKLPLPLDGATIAALDQWLHRLETNFAAGMVQPIAVGLANWRVKVQGAIVTEQQTLTANRLPLETRRELRGRLNALKAKALGRGLAEDPTLSALATQAKQLLYTRPTSLMQATELVKQYEQQLNRIQR